MATLPQAADTAPATQELPDLMRDPAVAPGPVDRRHDASSRVTSVSFVIPAKNEAASIGATLQALQQVLAEQHEGLPHEILVVDDGSTDGTGEIARAHGAVVVRHERSLGNGAAVKRGFRASRGAWVLLMDADGQHPPSVVPRLLQQAEQFDMVVASRGGAGGAWHRNLANRIYNVLASYVTSRRIPDLTSGFRLVRGDVARRLVYLLPNTFSYPTTITLAMLRSGYDVEFVPFAVRPREGKSHIKLLQDGSRFFMIILKIATFFAPLRVFVPLAGATFGLGLAWYAYTYLVEGRFTNMAALLLSQASIVFVLGLVSEQVAALRFERFEAGGRGSDAGVAPDDPGRLVAGAAATSVESR